LFGYLVRFCTTVLAVLEHHSYFLFSFKPTPPCLVLQGITSMPQKGSHDVTVSWFAWAGVDIHAEAGVKPREQSYQAKRQLLAGIVRRLRGVAQC
jgi:hypothetical protein